jgi:PIN domain nuclease of toxin-antitoxin system
MRLLLDTQLIVWWMKESDRLPKTVIAILGESDAPAYVSRVSQWELAIKIANRKLEMDLPRFTKQVVPDGFEWLEIKSEHLLAVATLPTYDDHKDPFDRLLIAQSLTEPLIFLTADKTLARYGTIVRVV